MMRLVVLLLMVSSAIRSATTDNWKVGIVYHLTATMCALALFLVHDVQKQIRDREER